MNKKILFLILSGVLMLPAISLAQLQPYAPSSTGAPQISTIAFLVGSLENLAALIFGAIAVIMFVIAGILFLTASGEPEKIKTAKAAFMWGVAGVVVGIIAFSIIAIVASFLTPASTTQSTFKNIQQSGVYLQNV